MLDFLIFLIIGLGLVLVVRNIATRARRNPHQLPLPPGPKGLPLLGNVFQLPQSIPWEGYNKLAKEYGDLIYFNAMGQDLLLLGSHQRADDLLVKKAFKFSDRPDFPMVDMMDLGWNLGTMPYGAAWRQYRRNFHQYLNNHAVQEYHPIMHEETKTFLRTLKSNPDKVFVGLQCFFATTIIRTAYGFENNEPLIHLAETLVQELAEAAVPGRFLVNHFPLLRYVPSWFPGAGFQKHFKQVAQMNYDVLFPPFEEAKRDVENGKKSSHPCIAHNFVDRLAEESDSTRAGLEEIARGVCAVAYTAGAETTVSSATALVYVLASYPEVQARGQAEIDTVIGSDRLPLVKDRGDLPYVHAIVKEVSRWYTVVPLGVPHSNIEDDEYDGYFIPKGTMIIPNNWAMMHNPDVFDQPFEFIPERYLKDGKLDPSVPGPETAAFGHGRRICPGRHFSNDALFFLAASLLATYEVAAPKDEEGNVIPLKLELKNPAITKALPFKCEIRLRAGREHLLQ